MITGWKIIIQHTGFSRNTLKRLANDENFPLEYIASKPTTTSQAIETWFQKRLEAKKKK